MLGTRVGGMAARVKGDVLWRWNHAVMACRAWYKGGNDQQRRVYFVCAVFQLHVLMGNTAIVCGTFGEEPYLIGRVALFVLDEEL